MSITFDKFSSTMSINLDIRINMTISTRIDELFADKPSATNADVAKFIGCERASIGALRKGNQKSITPKIGFGIADYFSANPRWLMLGKGKKYPEPIKLDYAQSLLELKALKLFRDMTDFQREEWLAIGEQKANEADRFRKALTPDFDNNKN